MATQNGALKRLCEPFDGFVVDGFNYQKSFPDVRHWLLSHAHADHTCGLTSSFDLGTIYCSSITRSAIERDISPRLRERCVTIDVGETIDIEGCSVRALDAGHCPGSLLFEFESRDGTRALHTGDFRASDVVRNQIRRGGHDYLYLDTTYASPKWTFPAQREACSILADIVREQLRRQPSTLFIVGTYSIGKENAVDAVVKATQGGLAWVPRRRAEALKFCGRWDDELHSLDKSARRICVWVDSLRGMGGGGAGTPHDDCLKILNETNFDAVCAFRCTGWEYRRGKQYSEWIDNDGRTRLYGVPYSEHSSFDELKAFVGHVKPKRIEPTVNADSRESRRALRDLFAKETDLARDLGKLDSFNNVSQDDALKRVDVQGQRKLLAELRRTNKREGGERAPDSKMVAKLAQVIPGAPKAYIERLLRDATNDPDQALSIHFGPNRGKFVDFSDGADEDDDDDDDALLLGAVFDVYGSDDNFKLFKGAIASSSSDSTEASKAKRRRQNPKGAADRVRSRLRELGATVVEAYAKGEKKLAPTHVIVPEGTDPKALINLDKLVVVKPESWLLRKSKKLQSGTISPPTPQQLLAAAKKTEKRSVVIKDVSACGEKRKGPRRRATSEALVVRDRSSRERFYLVERRDETASSNRFAPAPKHVFAVMGSTGNVYEVTIHFEPRCSCPFAVQHPTKVCKHRFFVLCKVLHIPDDLDYVAFQRHLRSDELRAVLGRSENAATLAAAAARSAYSGEAQPSLKDSGCERRRLEEDTCCVCFDSFALESTDEWCRSCGVNVHSDCLSRWLTRGQSPSCPACRADWVSAAPIAADAENMEEEGFLNLRKLQPGVPEHRDTSTYAVDAEGTQWRNRHADRRASTESDHPEDNMP